VVIRECFAIRREIHLLSDSYKWLEVKHFAVKAVRARAGVAMKRYPA
jgi:hypothetical protein